ASEARGGCETGRFVEHVLLALLGLGQFVHPFLHHHMTGSTGAVAAACVFEVNLVPKQDVEDRAGTAVMMKRRIGGVELDHPVGVAVFEFDAQLRHCWDSGYASASACETAASYAYGASPQRLRFRRT